MEQVRVSENGILAPAEPVTFDVAALRPSEIRNMWERIAPLLQSALDYGMPMPAEAIYAEALQYRAQIWVVMGTDLEVKGAAATTVVGYGGGQSALRVIALAGSEFNKWQPMIIEAFEKFARGVGCNSLEAVGRKGWGKSLTTYGFEQKYVTFIKELV